MKTKRQRRRRRPSVDQLRIVSMIADNGWDQGAGLKRWPAEERRRVRTAFESFDAWVRAVGAEQEKRGGRK